FSKQNLAAIGTIGYASTMIPEWSPIDVRRASEVDRTGLPESFVPAPGLLDVWDELKGLFSGSSNGSMAGNSYMAGQTGGEMKLKVEVSDDRVKVTPTYLPKGFTIDPDMGAN
ncbi:TPA: phage tail tape measure protein, partial [Vibrio cholerae]|nr:phage tail tape measure protein [Vibrio cholerae]HAS3410426.1 phage tail tape measure protein [Vibrio cholerae]